MCGAPRSAFCISAPLARGTTTGCEKVEGVEAQGSVSDRSRAIYPCDDDGDGGGHEQDAYVAGGGVGDDGVQYASVDVDEGDDGGAPKW